MREMSAGFRRTGDRRQQYDQGCDLASRDVRELSFGGVRVSSRLHVRAGASGRIRFAGPLEDQMLLVAMSPSLLLASNC